MNATMVALYTDTWGYKINGSLNGMVGDLSHGKAELAGYVPIFKLGIPGFTIFYCDLLSRRQSHGAEFFYSDHFYKK